MSDEKAKHTPGPWRVEKRGAQFSSDMIKAPSINGAIPLAWVAKLNERETNAALIAAAPDLLAALKQLECFVRLPSYSGVTREEALKAALAAIARAEGKS